MEVAVVQLVSFRCVVIGSDTSTWASLMFVLLIIVTV